MQPGGGGRRGRRLIALLLGVCILVGSTVAVVRDVAGRGSASGVRAQVPPQVSTDRKARSVPDTSPEDLRRAAVRATLDRRARALLTRDKAAFLATVDPASRSFRAKQSAYFDNLARVPISSWTYTLETGLEGPASGVQFARYHAPVWVPHVRVHYQLAGFDTVPTLGDAYYTFVRRGSQWLIGADADDARLGFTTTRDIWDFGPVVVVRGKRSLVLAHPGSRVSLRGLADELDRDVPRVTAVWGTGWSRRVVGLVPASQSELGAMLTSPGDLSQIAAVASAELEGSAGTPVGDRIILNPGNYAKLGPLGRRVVVTHEITHVASRRDSGDLLPTWLVEGLADYVGYKDTGVPVTVAASELRKDLRAGKPLGGLPADKAYDGSNKALAQAYEKSWLACRYIAERYGQAALVSLYRMVGRQVTGSSTAAVDTAMRTVLHLTLSAFVTRWTAYVRAALA